jgi:hypothetical protein
MFERLEVNARGDPRVAHNLTECEELPIFSLRSAQVSFPFILFIIY